MARNLQQEELPATAHPATPAQPAVSDIRVWLAADAALAVAPARARTRGMATHAHVHVVVTQDAHIAGMHLQRAEAPAAYATTRWIAVDNRAA